MNKEQEEDMNPVLHLRVDIGLYDGKYVGMVRANHFNCLHVTKPWDEKIDAIYELIGFLTHLKNEADKCLNELFNEKYEILISNEQKVKRTKK